MEEQLRFLRTEGGLYDDEMPGFGGVVEAAQEDAAAGQCAPPYWPAGVPVTTRDLALHVEEKEYGQTA